MNRGDVLIVDDYEFQNGGRANKLFVVLHCDESSNDVICVVTTPKQGGHRKKNP